MTDMAARIPVLKQRFPDQGVPFVFSFRSRGKETELQDTLVYSYGEAVQNAGPVVIKDLYLDGPELTLRALQAGLAI